MLEVQTQRDLESARREVRKGMRCVDRPVGAIKRAARCEQRLQDRVRNGIWNRNRRSRRLCDPHEAQTSDALLEVVAGLMIQQVEDIKRELQVEAARQAQRLRV